MKGQKNRPSMKDLAAKLAEDGETPLEFLVKLQRTPMPDQLDGEDAVNYLRRQKEHQAIQIDAAKAAAPYIHPRLQTTTIAQEDDKPFKVAVDLNEGARRIAFVLAKAARAK